MEKQFFEKKTIIYISVFLFTAICGFLLIFKSSFIRHSFNSVYSNVQYYISYSAYTLSTLKDEYADYISSVSKLRKLKLENERLIQKVNEQSFIENQNNELKRLLKFSSKIPRLVVTTRIISSSIDTYIGRMIIPVGTNEGIKIGMGIANQLGVIGKVIDVDRNFSDILLITDPNSRIVGFNPETNDKMILSGIGDGRLKAYFAEIDSKMKVGDIIYTTGEGGYFPEGLVIGKIIYKKGDDIILEPIFDVQKTHYVQVIGNQISRQG